MINTLPLDCKGSPVRLLPAVKTAPNWWNHPKL